MTSVALFDLDGTLLDTPGAIASAMADAVREVTGRTIPVEEARMTVGLPLPAVVARLALSARRPESAARIQEAYLDRFETVLVPRASALVFEGVPEGLRALRESAAPIGVVTSKNRLSAMRMLDAAGLLTSVDLVVGADDVTEPKPSPEGLLLAARRLGPVDRGRVFYVGDTAHDMIAARAAGARAIGVSYGVGSPGELLRSGASVAVRSFLDACVVGAASTGLVMALQAP